MSHPTVIGRKERVCSACPEVLGLMPRTKEGKRKGGGKGGRVGGRDAGREGRKAGRGRAHSFHYQRQLQETNEGLALSLGYPRG